MGAPTNAAYLKKGLVGSEPFTLGEKRKWLDRAQTDVIDPSAGLSAFL